MQRKVEAEEVRGKAFTKTMTYVRRGYAVRMKIPRSGLHVTILRSVMTAAYCRKNSKE